MIEFTIKQQLPSLNEYISQLNNNKYVGAKFKREMDMLCASYCLGVKKSIRNMSDNAPVYIEFEWHERTRKRDVDNVYSAKKYILDGMQQAGALANDDPRHVADVRDKLIYDGREFVIIKVMTFEEYKK